MECALNAAEEIHHYRHSLILPFLTPRSLAPSLPLSYSPSLEQICLAVVMLRGLLLPSFSCSSLTHVSEKEEREVEKKTEKRG